MSKFVEKVLDNHLREIGANNNYIRLSGETNNETYKVPATIEDIETDLAVIILRNPSLWWKVDQEKAIRNIIGSDANVKIPRLLFAEFDRVDNEKFGYIVREFMAGNDYDEVFSSQERMGIQPSDISALVKDLGTNIAMLHRHRTPDVGFVGKQNEHGQQYWGEYILGEITKCFRRLSILPAHWRLGSIGTEELRKVIPGIEKLIGSNQSALFKNDWDYLCHGDAHFRNIIAKLTPDQIWTMSGMIDTDEALGGDPGIDIASIENWLYFTIYQNIFYQHKEDFMSGYQVPRLVSEHYSSRRLIYHALRSASYLQAVSTFEPNAFVKDPRNLEYVEKHYGILKSLAGGNELKDLGIVSLI